MTLPPEEQVDINVGARVRTRREALGLSQDQVANALNVSSEQFASLERGEVRFNPSSLVRIATFLRVPISYLFGGESNPGNPASRTGQTTDADLSTISAALDENDLRDATEIARRILQVSRSPHRKNALQLLACAEAILQAFDEPPR